MPRAIELLQQGRREELWQMCCGFLGLDLEQFMNVQKRLLLEQLTLLNQCQLGNKIMRGARPETVEEFRRVTPLTTYADYCPELEERREDALPAKVALWAHTSGRSGDYSCKWVPMSQAFAHELGIVMYAMGILSHCKKWGDTSLLPLHPKMAYTMAPRPYMTGAMATLLEEQTPVRYLPPLEEAENMPFEERVQLAFRQALDQGLDYFFGLSLVLTAVGDKLASSSGGMSIRPFLSQPRVLFRLARGKIKSKLFGRPMLPRDLWRVKGIISSGLDSWVYRDRIKDLWGVYPLDVYAGTEGGIYATQTWDHNGMTFVPQLNFYEFIPEKEHLKWQLDPSYQPKTILLDEVKAGEVYEIVITNFHGGIMTRYRIGDMIRITSLKNEKLGINLPQMVYERRADGLLDFVVIRLTEKTIWQALENSGIPYADWMAYKEPGEPVLRMFVEPKEGYHASEAEMAARLHEQIMKAEGDEYTASQVRDDFADMINFRVEVTSLPVGSFANFTRQRQAEGADLAHLKPPHINPSEKVLMLLQARPEMVPEVAVGREARPVRVT